MMKRKGLKMLSAVLLTTMFINSIPVTAHAEEDTVNVEEIITEDSATTSSTEVQKDEIEVVEDIITELEDTNENVESIVTDISDVSDENLDANGGAPTTQEVIDTAITDATLPDSSTNEVVSDDIEEVKENVENIEEIQEDINNQFSEAENTAIKADEKADEIVSTVENTEAEVNKLIDDMSKTDDAKQANEIYEEINAKIEETSLTLSQQKEAFQTLKETFDDIVLKLEESNENMDSQLMQAKENAKDIEEKLAQLDKQIETSSDSTSSAVDELKKDAENAENHSENIDDNQSSKLSMWNKARNKMYIIIQDYYIPQFVDENATNITFQYVKGFDTQDLNYNIVTYTDKDGNTQTLYFNYDMTDKEYNPNDHWATLGNSGKIVMYEKSVDEINADNYLKTYFKNQKINVKQYANSGKLDVFKYTDEAGNVQYMVREEYEKALKDGSITEEQAELVVINANSKAKGGSNYLDETEDEKYNAFLNSSDLYEKFLAYEEKVENAKEVMEDAKSDAKALSDAIDTLTESKSKTKVTSILSDEDLAKLKAIMTEDELASLETMTVKEGITFLKDFVKKAQEKVDEAVLNYEAIVKKCDEIKVVSNTETTLSDIVVDNTPSEDVSNLAASSNSENVSNNEDVVNTETASIQNTANIETNVLSWTNESDEIPVLSSTFSDNSYEDSKEVVLNESDDESFVETPNVKITDNAKTSIKTPVENVKTAGSTFTAQSNINYLNLLWLILLIVIAYAIYKKYSKNKEEN